MSNLDSITILQQWYECNCNNNWEHENGVKIESLDNPGWSISLDLTDTPLDGLIYSVNKQSINTDKWYSITVENNILKGFGNDLSEIIQLFYQGFLLPNLQTSLFRYTIYTNLENSTIKLWRPLIAKMIDLKKFVIIEIPEFHIGDLLVSKTEDWSAIDYTSIDTDISLKKGSIVACSLEMLCDGVVLVTDM